MPGTNHDVEAGFMDELPFPLRDAAVDLITYSTLREMLDIFIHGPTPFLKRKFEHTEKEWRQLSRAVLLTKVSYFELNPLFPNRDIDRLCDIAVYAYGQADGDLVSLYHEVVNKYPYFADWLKSVIEVKQQKLRIQKNHEKLAAAASKGDRTTSG